MCSISYISRKHALSILTCFVLCSTALSSGCNSTSSKQSDHPNTAEGKQAAAGNDHSNTAKSTAQAVKEVVAIVDKSLADLPPPPSAPAACEEDMKKVREVSKKSPGTQEATIANSALLRCTSKAINDTNCKGKPQPCGVVYYNPPIKPPGSAPKAVDVSVPDQIAAACKEIAQAGTEVLSTSAAAGPPTGFILGAMTGNYSCGAWFKAAAGNNPTLLVLLGFVPSIQLIRDLKTYTNGVVDKTPESVLADIVKPVDITLVTIRVGGAIAPVAVLPIAAAGSTPGQVLDGAHDIVRQRVNQLSKAVEDGCKAAGICE